ncbi:hypothetical protein [Pseudarthrobacter sp. H2]|uniref:hypothetical protein n=1 Tax=Pseudarthrobacter sp. H2 TaxID=3418415 RepID=UPI003CF11266
MAPFERQFPVVRVIYMGFVIMVGLLLYRLRIRHRIGVLEEHAATVHGSVDADEDDQLKPAMN